jgi:hypothetical protein
MGMAAKASEQGVGGVEFPMDCGEGIEKMKAFDGAAGAVGVTFLVGEDECRSSGTVDDT